MRVHQPEVAAQVHAETPLFLAELEKVTHTGKVVVGPTGEIRVETSRVLEHLFSTYDPAHIGIIEYHSAQRSYQREQVGGINLNIQTTNDQRSHSALCNTSNKYSNIKAELASGYIQDLLSTQAGVEGRNTVSLTQTLEELFQIFFPGKRFVGPQPTPDDRLLFNVETSNGSVHDINDLSSGEKEVLYGYLRLRNSTPKHSVLLIDEPEMHLNPRLIEGLPQFYHRNLGKAMDNQLWLVTHSDTLIRQAVGNEGFSVFHMQPPSRLTEDVNQLKEVKASGEIERLVMDLVGDLAAYRPGAKVVILEGGGESDFDVNAVASLFPEFSLRVNLISGGNKARVQELQSILQAVSEKGTISGSFFAITDRDSDAVTEGLDGSVFSWDRYHIENYLLEPEYIKRVIKDLPIPDKANITNEEILNGLREAASKTLPSLVKFELERHINSLLVSCINTRIDPNARELAAQFDTVVKSSARRISQIVNERLSLTTISELEEQYKAQFQADLNNGKWLITFRGRDILRRFTSEFLGGVINYEVMRNLILSRMRDASYQPPGMLAVIDRIMS